MALAGLLAAGEAVAAPAGGQILGMPMRFEGNDATSPMSVAQFLSCLKHGPIPLKLADVSDRGSGTYLLRVANDLEEYEMSFRTGNGVAVFSKLNRDNGGPLSAPQDLRRFVNRACRQARLANPPATRKP